MSLESVFILVPDNQNLALLQPRNCIRLFWMLQNQDFTSKTTSGGQMCSLSSINSSRAYGQTIRYVEADGYFILHLITRV